MFCIIDRENNHLPVKSGFKTAAQANNWAKKHLSKDDVHLWGEPVNWEKWRKCRYHIQMKIK